MNVTTTRYGAELSGLICGYRFLRGGGGQALDTQQALDWLAAHAVADAAQDADEFVWLHFNLTQPATEKWLREHLDLSDVYYEALAEGSRSTRIEYADGAMIAVVNDVHYDFSFEPSEISTIWLSVNERVMISARRQPLRSIDRLRAAVQRGEAFNSPVELLVHLLHDQGDVLVDIVRGTNTRVDTIEDNLLAGRRSAKRADLGGLRRLLVRLQRLLAPEPAALFRLLQRPPAWMADADVQELRQSTEEYSVVLRDMASLQERIKLLQEEIAASVNEDNNRSLFVLTIVTVLALPINIIAGLLGMNVGGIPLAQHENGFWIVVTIIVTFTVIAGWVAFRKKRD